MEQKLCAHCEEPIIEKVPGCPLQCGAVQCKAYQRKSKFDPETKPIVWVLGGPGCGKFTQCSKIVEVYGFTHLSAGDIIRGEVASNSKQSKCLNSIMNRGGLVPNDLVLSILKEAMERAAEKGTHGYLVDGYPREKSQGVQFEKAVGRVSLILFFDAPAEVLVQRLKMRASSSIRQDDKPYIMKHRIRSFLKNNESVMEPFKDRVVKINAVQSADAVFEEVRKAMDALVAHAAAVEAQAAEADALTKARAAEAFAHSTRESARRSVIEGNLPAGARASIAYADAEAAKAEAEVKAAHERSEAATEAAENPNK